MKSNAAVLVYGHEPDDVNHPYWDIQSWSWHIALVDAPIAPLVHFLNVNGVRTLASCCGHNKERGHVSIVEWSVPKALSLGLEVGRAPDGWSWAVLA
jgi:hypothetical protein